MTPTEWTDIDKLLYECDSPKEDTIRFEGHTRDYWVIPYVPVLFHSTSKSTVQAWEPRKPWHTGRARRAAYWVIHATPQGAESCDLIDHHAGQFKTRREAITAAQRLAAEEKTIALLKGE